jgi:hypothetical protein
VIVRFNTIERDHFRHEGLAFGRSWTEVDLASLAEPQVAVLTTYVGTVIQVHPLDVAQLPAAGFELVDGRLVTRAAEAAPDAGEEDDDTDTQPPGADKPPAIAADKPHKERTKR